MVGATTVVVYKLTVTYTVKNTLKIVLSSVLRVL